MDVQFVGTTGVSSVFSISGIETNMFQTEVFGLNSLLTDSPGFVQLIRGEYVNIIEALKPLSWNLSASAVGEIELIIPGPIANISYGIRIGRELEKIKVPRLYPPIYINPTERGK